jgi:hypothetical protein
VLKPEDEQIDIVSVLDAARYGGVGGNVEQVAE